MLVDKPVRACGLEVHKCTVVAPGQSLPACSTSVIIKDGQELKQRQSMQARMQALGAHGAFMCVPEQCRTWSRQLMHAQPWQRRTRCSAGCEVRAGNWRLGGLLLRGWLVVLVSWAMPPDKHCMCRCTLHLQIKF